MQLSVISKQMSEPGVWSSMIVEAMLCVYVRRENNIHECIYTKDLANEWTPCNPVAPG